VLPALAIAYGRRIDLYRAAADRPGSVSLLGKVSSCCSLGYFGWSVAGYGLGLAVTLAANAYGWTFNGVQGQPALLYVIATDGH
jgi:hypothetical protein